MFMNSDRVYLREVAINTLQQLVECSPELFNTCAKNYVQLIFQMLQKLMQTPQQHSVGILLETLAVIFTLCNK